MRAQAKLRIGASYRSTRLNLSWDMDKELGFPIVEGADKHRRSHMKPHFCDNVVMSAKSSPGAVSKGDGLSIETGEMNRKVVWDLEE